MKRLLLACLLLVSCSQAEAPNTSVGTVVKSMQYGYHQAYVVTSKGGGFTVEGDAILITKGQEANYSDGKFTVGGEEFSAKKGL